LFLSQGGWVVKGSGLIIKLIGYVVKTTEKKINDGGVEINEFFTDIPKFA